MSRAATANARQNETRPRRQRDEGADVLLKRFCKTWLASSDPHSPEADSLFPACDLLEHLAHDENIPVSRRVALRAVQFAMNQRNTLIPEHRDALDLIALRHLRRPASK